MSLFDGCRLPDDERALEIIQRISDLWENNAGVKIACDEKHPNPGIYHQRVSMELKEILVELSVSAPKTLEDMLNEETSLHNILQFAQNAMSGY